MILRYMRAGSAQVANGSARTKSQWQVLKSADEARDRAAWLDAARFYRQYLNQAPSDSAIWTQYGHALKEHGLKKEAEAAYRTGLAFAPQDAELYLQLGHLLKILGRLEEAEHAYLRSSALDPTLGAEAEIAWRKGSVAQQAAPSQPPQAASASRDPIQAVSATRPLSQSDEPPGVVDADDLQREADRYRDAQDWPRAANLYQAFLDLRPEHGGVLVQLGHTLRNQGDLRAAERAYRAAIQTNDADADAYFQLGHVLTLQKRPEQALEAFHRSLTISPSRDTVVKIREGGFRVEYDDIPLCDDIEGRVFFEVSDLFATMREQATVSGIQRVQLGLLKHILQNAAKPQVVFWDHGLLWCLPSPAMRDAIHLYDAAIGMSRRSTLIAEMMSSAQPVRPGSTDTFVITGAIWKRHDAATDHQKLRNDGCRLGAYIYDFIPLTNPEFCHSWLTACFSNTIAELMLQLDFALTISDFVAEEFKRLRQEAGFPEIPVQTVRLAHLLDDTIGNSPDTWTDLIADLQNTKFVLCVGSVAAHKNHIMLLQVWRILAGKGVPPPTLVIVGQVGYGVADLVSQLENSRNLDGLVRIIHGINDDELATLYRACLFTVFPSFVEGWGLPVGESLVFGKVCVASHTTSIPEVGGECVVYIDPYNVRESVAAIDRLLSDDVELSRRERHIARGFKPRSLGEFGAEFLAAIDRSVGAGHRAHWALRPMSVARPKPFRNSWPFGASLPQYEQVAKETMERVILTRGWWPGEDWGRWMDGPVAAVTFPTTESPGTQVRVILQCRPVPWPRRNRLSLTAGCGSRTSVAIPLGSGEFIVTLDCVVDRRGSVKLLFEVSGILSGSGSEPRTLGVGLCRLFYLAAKDVAWRLPSCQLFKPTALVGSAGVAVSGYGRDALIEAARRQQVMVEGWMRPEAWGSWMETSTASLLPALECSPGTRVRMVLRLCSEAPQGGSVTVKAAGGTPSVVAIIPGQDRVSLVNVVGTVSQDGTLPITLRADVHGGKTGISGLVWCRIDDEQGRLRIVETLIFGDDGAPVDDSALLLNGMEITVTGHLSGSYSLASVNRRLALALDDAMPGAVNVVQVEGEPRNQLDGMGRVSKARLTTMAQRRLAGDGPHVVISQHYPIWQPRPPGDLPLSYLFWEESLVPRDMIAVLNAGFRGVLVPARSVAKALVDSGLRIPVRIIGFAPDLTAFAALAVEREAAALRATDQPFTFLHVSSCFPRKGVDILIAAYTRAFTHQDNVRLVIKGFPNPHNEVASQLSLLREANADTADIVLIDRDLPEEELLDLYKEADAVVLPTRGEGFNIPAAEAMAAGIPLIVTGFGGQADFSSNDVARLVDYRFTHSRSHLRSSSSVWVEPDVDDLSDALREAVAAARLPQDPFGKRARTVAAARLRARQVGDSALWAARVASVAAELLAAPPVRRMKIAWVSTWNIRCGIAEYSRLLLESFPKAMMDVTVLCDTRTEQSSAIRSMKVWKWLSTVDGGIPNAVRELDADIVMIQFHPGLIGWVDVADIVESEQVRLRHVMVTIHNTLELLDTDPASQRRFITAMQGVDRVLVHSVADLNLLKAQGLVENVTLFPHGAVAAAKASRAVLPLSVDQEVVIGTYGFFLEHKGFYALIEAFAIIRRTYTRARLRLVTAEYPNVDSPVEIARCRQRAHGLGLDGAIEWHTDYLPNEASLDLLGACDLLVLPYQHTKESSSAAVRNALSAGVPVLVTPLQIFEELQDAVLRLNDTSVESIANGTLWLLHHEETRRILVRAAASYLNDASWPVVAERLNGMMHGLMFGGYQSQPENLEAHDDCHAQARQPRTEAMDPVGPLGHVV